MAKKFVAALSDADILIHLASVNKLDMLDLLFEQIIIPKYVFEVEVKKKAGKYLKSLEDYINSPDNIFTILDREKRKEVNVAALPIINDKRIFCGRGESECAGYASALKIPIILSDNKNDFRHFEEYIMLKYTCVLTLCINFGYLEFNESKKIFEAVNNKLQYPTGKSFSRIVNETYKRFEVNGWNDYLGIHHIKDVEVAITEKKEDSKNY